MVSFLPFLSRDYDVRVAPNFLPAVMQYHDKKYEIAHKAVKSLKRRYTSETATPPTFIKKNWLTIMNIYPVKINGLIQPASYEHGYYLIYHHKLKSVVGMLIVCAASFTPTFPSPTILSLSMNPLLKLQVMVLLDRPRFLNKLDSTRLLLHIWLYHRALK